MSSLFTDRLTRLIEETPAMAPEALPHVRPAFEDTLAVAYAGWGEPVTRRLASAYPGCESQLPGQAQEIPPETAAFLWGTAAHALDFDDVHQTSCTHPSAPIVAALVAAASAQPELRVRVVSAFAVGLAANIGLGRVLGFPHYEMGWHATSTIGPLATAAALAHLYGLDRTSAAHALSLAAAQAGGMQRNFGTMAKPVQAGLAAAAGWRAATLARAGVTADHDPFGDKGVFDLYGGQSFTEEADSVEFDLETGGISVKLYPCCYMTHKPIAAALLARDALLGKGIDPATLSDVEVNGPPGSFLPLRVSDPKVGSEGKFCGEYTVACALLDGAVGLAHFEDDAVGRPDVRALLARVRMVEREGKPDGIQRRAGPLRLTAWDASGEVVASLEVEPSPGSPDQPPSAGQMETKVRDCLAHFRRSTGGVCEYEEFQLFVDDLLALHRPATLQAAAGD